MPYGKLYLIPTGLGSGALEITLPQTVEILISTKFYIVENIRTARRFISSLKANINIDSLQFFELNKHTNPNDISSFIKPAFAGEDVGLLSEAGLPGVADPGAKVVSLAHQNNINVIPLPGASSLFLALMASGLNGQQFAFNGYLPVRSNERMQKIRFFENRSRAENQSQIFIETPYRNNALLKDFVSACNSKTHLCIAADLTMETEFINTKTIGEWKNKLPDLHKRPAVFIIQLIN